MDQIEGQALTGYARMAGMKRLEAVANSNGNGKGDGTHNPSRTTGSPATGYDTHSSLGEAMMTERPLTSPPLALWAGVEATVNRVGEIYADQLERSGHAVRLGDLDRLAELGVEALRYPVLWERTAPVSLECINWSWADERLDRLRELGLRPIVGLVHHGSGPRYTSLLDPEFPEKLASYARSVALRFPWVEDYTPVNEPLTTARFSCLYGHWYPHQRDSLMFARALLGQCRGAALAIREIRKINPAARLIQTEDLGNVFSTPPLAYQAEFENERRWLTFDLLCGRVAPNTPMWDYLSWVGVEPRDLEWFLANPTPPDIIGINHYITSQRFLDHRVGRYPLSSHGGNGRHSYADVEAVRVCGEGVLGPKAILREAWERYEVPIAITEAHLACTREEQLRWLKEIWDAAQQLRNEQVDVRAVTAWSAFGAYDWNSLLTRDEGFYEPGVFDLRAPAPRPTALAKMARGLASGQDFDHPVLDGCGWWHRLDRLCYPPVFRSSSEISASVRGVSTNGESSRPLLIVGANGTLGKAFARICEQRGLAYYLLNRQAMDIAELASVEAALQQFEPWAVINAAGYVRVDDAERDEATCMRENARGPVTLANACAARGIAFVTFSSDLVFDGLKAEPYVESDLVSPLSVYGRSKAEAEAGVLDVFPDALVVRTSAFFGPWDEFNFVTAVLNSLSSGHVFYAAADMTISPTYVPDLVNTVLDLLIDDEHGVWHVANSGSVTWAEFATLVARASGYDRSKIEGRPNRALNLIAPRPSFSVLASERARLMPTLEQGIDSYYRDRGLSRAKSVGLGA